MTEPEKASIMLKYDLTEEEIEAVINKYGHDIDWSRIKKIFLFDKSWREYWRVWTDDYGKRTR